MKYKLPSDLLVIDILSLLLIAAIAFLPSLPIRIILGLPFLLFFPGYVFLAALYPRADGIERFERLALSFGFSIALTGLLGLGLNFTPWGITVASVTDSLTILIVAMSVVAYYRRRAVPGQNGFPFRFHISLASWKQQALPHRILTAALVVLIAGAIGTLVFVVVSPKIGETYTEFYVLGTRGQAADYPRQLEVGQPGAVTVGIINREHATTKYRLEVKVEGVASTVVDQLVLEQNETWENPVVFTPDKVGQTQEVQFLLYNLDSSTTQAYRELHFWIDVADRTQG